jgi:hypothetical protein
VGWAIHTHKSDGSGKKKKKKSVCAGHVTLSGMERKKVRRMEKEAPKKKKKKVQRIGTDTTSRQR